MDANLIVDYLGAGFSLFHVDDRGEQRRAVTQIRKHLEEARRKDGVRYEPVVWDCTVEGNPEKPLLVLDQAKEGTIVIAKNYHWFMHNKPFVVQRIQNSVEGWKHQIKAFIIVSPKMTFPREIEKDIMPLRFGAPTDDELTGSVQFIVDSLDGKVKAPRDEGLEDILAAGRGLGLLEFENALSLSVRQHKTFEPSFLYHQKAAAIQRTGFMEVIPGLINFSDCKGFDVMKSFSLPIHPRDLGFLMISPPGCGKTWFMNALVGETGMLGLKLDIGKLFGKYHGETDANVSTVIDLITANRPCIVVADEFEKQFSGAGGSGDTDSGVTRRNTARWLTFMEGQDRPEGVFIIGATNSFEGIPDEYLRIGRWDCAPFYIDLPTNEEKAQVWDYWVAKENLQEDKTYKNIDTDKWTPAEISGCCHIAANKGYSLEQAANFIIPQALSAKTSAEELRDWAKDRCIFANSLKTDKAGRVRRIDI